MPSTFSGGSNLLSKRLTCQVIGFFLHRIHRTRKLTSRLPATCQTASSSMSSTTRVMKVLYSTTATEVPRHIEVGL